MLARQIELDNAQPTCCRRMNCLWMDAECDPGPFDLLGAWRPIRTCRGPEEETWAEGRPPLDCVCRTP